MFYQVYGYNTPEGEEHIVEFPDDREVILELEADSFDRWGYPIGQYETLEEARKAYPAAKVHLACSSILDQHKYTTRTCPYCHNEFCWECCKHTNIHFPSSSKPYMYCPICGRDVMR